MKILFVVNVDWFFISHRLDIALEAQRQGFEVHIACARTEKGLSIENYGFIIHNLNLSRANTSFFEQFHSILEINRVIKFVKPSLIHAITIKPVLYTSLLTCFSKIPKVFSVSGMGYVFTSESFKSRILRIFILLFYKVSMRGDTLKVIFQNSDDANIFLYNSILKESNATIIRGSGVHLDKYNYTDEPTEVPVVMLLSRLLIDKGIIEFVEAARILRKKGCFYRFVIVGDFDENPKSVSPQLIKNWLDEEIIEYWGYSFDVNFSYSKANLIVLPSYREGLPKSLIEAAACGRAVVTTDVPGCRDAIVHAKTGLLVTVRDSHSLAEAILKLCENVELRRKYASNGRRLAESEFDIQLVIRKHMEIYFSLLKDYENQ